MTSLATQVEICADAACSSVVQCFQSGATTGAPGTALTAGVYFWQLRALTAGGASALHSASWQVRIPAHEAPLETATGQWLDLNGDGFADAAVADFGQAGPDGVVRVYLGSPTGLPSSPSLTLPVPNGVSGFGYSMATIGDVDGDGTTELAVSAYYDHRVWVYMGSRGPFAGTAMPIEVVPVAMPTNAFGWSLASAGDVDGDGHADLLVGDISSPLAVELFVYSSGGFTYFGSISDGNATDALGSAMVTADFNADGFLDLAVGHMASGGDTGGVNVYFGTATPWVFNQISLDLFPISAKAGSALAAGDVNGDGRPDLVVGGAGSANNVWLYLGTSSGLGPQRTLFSAGTGATGIGTSVAVGDVNGDGYGDVATGAFGDTNAGGVGGRGFVLLGDPTLVTLPSPAVFPSARTNDQFGFSLVVTGNTHGPYANQEILAVAVGPTMPHAAWCKWQSGSVACTNLTVPAPSGSAYHRVVASLRR